MIVILGATASGKSALAETVARKIGADILSIDSMQVYRGMDIGTAKPTAADRSAILYHLVDVAEPDSPFTVAKFVELADASIAGASSRAVPIIATGGTPLYYKSLFEGLFEGPPANSAIREKLKLEPASLLHQRLSTIDPAAAVRIHANDSRRVIRALEVFELTGKPISFFQTDWESPARRYQATWFGLLWDRDHLNRRINARVRSMMAAGWVDEVESLLARYGELSHTAGEATGYREMIEYVRGRIKLDDCVERIKISTRQLARKQMKWFKRFPNVHWLPGDRAVEENSGEILQKCSLV